MANQTIQMINDEIICYKEALKDVKEKLSLVSFLNTVENDGGRSLKLDEHELLCKRDELERRLKSLVSSKVELTGQEDATEELKLNDKIQNSFLSGEYLSLPELEN